MAKKRKTARTPAAKDALARFKHEIAHELGIGNTSLLSNGDSCKDKPSVGDYLVEQMIKSQERKMK